MGSGRDTASGWLEMGYLKPQALENLKKYAYKGVDKSVVSNYVLNPYWNQLVKLCPTWIAPNTITATGLSLVIFNFFTLIYFDPEYLMPKYGAVGPPQWIFFIYAACLFMYQSLDAIDGKQARRTGMAGPLGEMFDHGCDALNTTLEVILACYALNLGRSWWTVASQAATLATFYLTTWEEYYTGQLYLGVFSGPVEGILMIIAIFLISGFKGPAFWDTGVLTFLGLDTNPAIADKIPNIGLNESFMVFGAFGLAFNIISSYINVYKARTAAAKPPLTPLLYLLPFVITVSLRLSWISTPTLAGSHILYSSEFVPFLSSWGLQFAHQVGRMILAHITKTPLPFFDWSWPVQFLCALDANLLRLFGIEPVIQTTPQTTALLVYVVLAFSFTSYVHFCSRVISEITNFLGIACFTVRKKDESGHWEKAQVVDAKKKK